MAEKTDVDQEKIKDYEGGYGGGRERVEQMHEHAFGERGWGTGGDTTSSKTDGEAKQPKGVEETHEPDWQEKFAKKNADKYGQWGGQPIEQRGPSHTTGGVPAEEDEQKK